MALVGNVWYGSGTGRALVDIRMNATLTPLPSPVNVAVYVSPVIDRLPKQM